MSTYKYRLLRGSITNSTGLTEFCHQRQPLKHIFVSPHHYPPRHRGHPTDNYHCLPSAWPFPTPFADQAHEHFLLPEGKPVRGLPLLGREYGSWQADLCLIFKMLCSQTTTRLNQPAIIFPTTLPPQSRPDLTVSACASTFKAPSLPLSCAQR